MKQLEIEDKSITNNHLIKLNPEEEIRIKKKLVYVAEEQAIKSVGDFRNEGGLRTKGYYRISEFLINEKIIPKYTPIYEKPLVTIITVVFNGEKFLEDTILSVINQSYSNTEYIIIDGGSTDKTLDIIKKYDDAIDYWISEVDGGIYDAMNKGISLASGKWINFMNADDYFVDSNVIESINLNNDYEFIYGKIILKDNDYKIAIGTEINSKNLVYKSICHHQSVFAKKDLYIKYNGFRRDLKISSDYDFFVKVFKSKISAKYVDYCIAVMRVGGVSSKNVAKSLSEKLMIIKENYDYTSYTKAILYQFLYERPRNYIRLIFYHFDLIKYWRRIRDY